MSILINWKKNLEPGCLFKLMKNSLKTISVLGKYDVVLGNNLIKNLDQLIDFSEFSQVIVITDINLDKLWLKKMAEGLPENFRKIVVGYGEKAKNIETIQQIWKDFLISGIDRKSLVINLGGGVIGDLGGFAASTYMRGISFVQIPTTLLAQVDASIGGKVAINLEGVKNLIGSFNQPAKVIIDVDVLKTLSKRELVSGFGEIIKHGLIADKDYFQLVTSKQPKDFSEDELLEIIIGSCQIKIGIVNQDEKEEGKRKLINFGHTIGHVIELLSLESNNPLLHGEAVSIGMVVESNISKLKGILPGNDFDVIKKCLNNSGLPTKIPNFSPDEIVGKIKSDKKSVGGVIKWTLLKIIGEALIDQTVEENILYEAIRNNTAK